jgi:hypothetical protein
MDYDRIAADISAIRLLLYQGQLTDALKKSAEVCVAEGPEEEPATLRDVRSDLLCFVLVSAMAVEDDSTLDNAALDVICALLERRVWNSVLGSGIEARMFGSLFPHGSGVFDHSFDRQVPLTLRDHREILSKREGFRGLEQYAAWNEWMEKQHSRVQVEVDGRVRAVKKGAPLRVGVRVKTEGLKRAEMNALTGILTCRQEGADENGWVFSRWGVIFDDAQHGRKAIKEENLTPIALNYEQVEQAARGS